MLEAPLWLYPEEIVSKLGIDAADEIRNRQSTLIAMMVSPSLLFTLHNNALRAADPYPVNEYLDDVFSLVWKPVNDANPLQNDYLRQQQRTYVDLLGTILNPVKDKESSSVDIKIVRSDVMLYAEQHLDKIETWLKAQPEDAHNRNLLLRIKKIRNKYNGNKDN